MQDQQNINMNGGRVILAGAGPGDPELITLKLVHALQSADIILCDRLVHPDIYRLHARPGVDVVLTGKQGYHPGSVPQADITQRMLDEAMAGRTVLRLKGGDLAFFSNVLDELEALVQRGIPYELIPGITAASGASAFAGIPLTGRGYARSVQFIAFHPSTEESEYDRLAGDIESVTKVLYMGAARLMGILEALRVRGVAASMPVAVVEKATTHAQQVHVSTLEEAAINWTGMDFGSPALVIIGRVVALHHQFSWYEPTEAGTSPYPALPSD
jgi:uroporphyrin-III C-methyltransferase